MQPRDIVKRHALFLFLAGSLSLLAAPSPAQDATKRLQEIERQIRSGQQKSEALDERARSLSDEIGGVNRARVEMARTIRELEQRMTDLETEIAVLDTTERQKRAALAEGRVAFSQLLSALQRMSRLPPEAIVAYPAPPSDLVRAAIVLRGVVPRIEERASALKHDIESLAETRTTISARRRELNVAGAELRSGRIELDKQLAAVNTERRQTLAERRAEEARLAKLTREAEGLRELFDRLDAERAAREARAKVEAPQAKPAAPQPLEPARRPGGAPSDSETKVASAAPFAQRRISAAQGTLPMPAIGRISGQYGEPMATGISRKGLDIETRPGARVVAPYDGKVVFAGPFRAYGLLLIIEHSEGYHTLLAGLSRIDTEVGQALLSGEPVGIMDTAENGSPSLYVELRRNGQPINPLPWLAARKGKANG